MHHKPDLIHPRDRFYRFIVTVGRFVMWFSSRPTFIGREHMPLTGPFIIASNHFSHFDFMPLMRTLSRHLDVLSTRGAFNYRFVGWFFGHMNALPLDRHQRDPTTVREMLERLAAGRAIVMYPEGNLRDVTTSVVSGGPFRPGVTRIARLANAPIVPAVVCGAGAYAKWFNWLPLRRVRYGVILGRPIDPADEKAAAEQLRAAFQSLYQQLQDAMNAP